MLNVENLQHKEKIITKFDKSCLATENDDVGLYINIFYLMKPHCTIEEIYLDCTDGEEETDLECINILKYDTSVREMTITLCDPSEEFLNSLENLTSRKDLQINLKYKYCESLSTEHIRIWKKLNIKSLKIEGVFCLTENFEKDFLYYIKNNNSLQVLYLTNYNYFESLQMKKLCKIMINHSSLKHLEIINRHVNYSDHVKFLQKIQLKESKSIKLGKFKPGKGFLYNFSLNKKDQLNELARENILFYLSYQDDVRFGLQFGDGDSDGGGRCQKLSIKNVTNFLQNVSSLDELLFFKQTKHLVVHIRNDYELELIITPLDTISNRISYLKIISLENSSSSEIYFKFIFNNKNIKTFINFINRNTFLKRLDLFTNFDSREAFLYFCEHFNNKNLNVLRLECHFEENDENGNYDFFWFNIVKFLNRNIYLLEVHFNCFNCFFDAIDSNRVKKELMQLEKNNLSIEKFESEICSELFELTLEKVCRKNKLFKNALRNFTRLLLTKDDPDISPTFKKDLFRYMEFILEKDVFEKNNFDVSYKRIFKMLLQNYKLSFIDHGRIQTLPIELKMYILSFLRIEDIQ